MKEKITSIFILGIIAPIIGYFIIEAAFIPGTQKIPPVGMTVGYIAGTVCSILVLHTFLKEAKTPISAFILGALSVLLANILHGILFYIYAYLDNKYMGSGGGSLILIFPLVNILLLKGFPYIYAGIIYTFYWTIFIKEKKEI